VDIRADKLEALLYLRKGIAGAAPLEMRAVSQTIRDSGVHGFDTEQLKASVKAFMESPDTEMSYVLVQGKAPARGKDRDLSLEVTPLEEAEARAVLARLGKTRIAFPLSEINGLARVEKGAGIGRLGAASEGEAGKDVYGAVLPGLPGNDPELKLFRGLGQHGVCITAEEEGLLVMKTGAGLFWGEVLRYRDARIRVAVSDDAMEVRAELGREEGAGLPLDARAVLAALAAAGVTRGIDREAVEKACVSARAAGSWSGVLARGEAPAAKNAPVVKWLIPGFKGGAVPVAAGTPVAEIWPGSPEGKPGFDVRGTVLSPDGVSPAAVSHDDSIREIPSGAGLRLEAARPGELRYDGTSLGVNSLRRVQGNAGKETGNINFPGDLRIDGKVESGFSVLGRKVFVAGLSEASLVSAGGRAVIAWGRRGAGRGIVRARGAIETAFVEAAVLLAVEDIKVSQGCAGCSIKTNGMLVVSGERGKLTGGVCRARRGISVRELGSEKGTRTEISFGQDYLLADQIEVTEREIEKKKAELAKIDIKIKAARNNPAALGPAGAEKVRILKALEQLNLRIFTMREKFEEHHESEVHVKGAVHPGVVMESHGRYYEVNRRREGVVFFFDRETGRIRER
jgi:uncharacterized protein (DUF342 family)